MSPHLTPDPHQARRFLQVLTQGDHAATFQTFSDRKELKKKLPNGKWCDPNANWHHGTFDALELHLMRQNAKGAGIYVMVNKGDGKGRAAENVQLVRALFLDTDGALYPTGLPLPPHIIVESSPGRWHIYWLVDGVALDDFGVIQAALAEKYGTDPTITDKCRVLRVPGFYHRKGEPVMVRLLEAHDHRPYIAAEVYAAWPFLPQRLERARVQEAEKVQRRAEIAGRAAERKATPSTDTSD